MSSGPYFTGSAADVGSNYRLCESNPGSITLCNATMTDAYMLTWSTSNLNASPSSLVASILSDSTEGFVISFESNTASLAYQASNTQPLSQLASGACSLGSSNDVFFATVLGKGRVCVNGGQVLSADGLSNVEWTSPTLSFAGSTLSNSVLLSKIEGYPMYAVEPPVVAKNGLIAPYLKGQLDWADLSNVPAFAPLSTSNAAYWSSNQVTMDKLWSGRTTIAFTNCNVGIGTSNPSRALDVYGGTTSAIRAIVSPFGVPLRAECATSNGVFLDVANSNARMLAGVDGLGFANIVPGASLIGSWSSNPCVLMTNATEKLRIMPAGNIGIGTTAPTEKLHVNGNIRATGFTGTGQVLFNLSNVNATNTGSFSFRNTNYGSNSFVYADLIPSTSDGWGGGYTTLLSYGYSNGAGRGLQPFYIQSSVGFGLSNPAYAVDVSGTANATTLREGGTLLATKYALSNHTHTDVASSNWAGGQFGAQAGSNAAFTTSDATIAAAVGTSNAALSNWSGGQFAAQAGSNVSLSNWVGGQFGAQGASNAVFASSVAVDRYWSPGSGASTAITACNIGVGLSNPSHQLHCADLGRFGDALVGTVAFSGFAGFAHKDCANTSSYAMLQGSTGYTYLNTTSNLEFRVNDVPKSRFNPTGSLAVRNGVYFNGGDLLTSSNAWYVQNNNSNLTFWYQPNQNDYTTRYEMARMSYTGDATLTVQGYLKLYNTNQTFYIQPGLAQSNNYTNTYTQFDMPGTATSYFWDNLQATGTFTAGGTKNFCIEHPLDSSQVLLHSCVEAPRTDLMYSGSCRLKKGRGTVSIDADSCPEAPMLPGTFEALTRNPRLYLQNNESFVRVKGEVLGGEVLIECEDPNCNDTVEWLVIAERRDPSVINSPATDSRGHLKTQQPKSKWMLDEEERPSKKNQR